MKKDKGLSERKDDVMPGAQSSAIEFFLDPSHDKSRDWTGERMAPRVSQKEFEYYHRYLLARELCRGKDVLDVASGEGHGSALLAQVARSVAGVDPSGVAISRAIASYSGVAGLSFICSDALAVPLADSSVDVVVSFGTLENLDRHDAFFAEIKRLMKPNAIFLVGIPDRERPDQSRNPVHLKELSRKDFAELIGRHFPSWKLFDQRLIVGSAIWPAGKAKSDSRSWMFERIEDASFQSSRGLPAARYFIAIASAQRLPVLEASLYFDQSYFDLQKKIAVTQEDHLFRSNEVESHVKKTSEMILSLNREFDELRKKIKCLKQESEDLKGVANRGAEQEERRERSLQQDALRGLLRQQAKVIERLHGELRRVQGESTVILEEIRQNGKNADEERKSAEPLPQRYEVVWVHPRLIQLALQLPSPIKRLLLLRAVQPASAVIVVNEHKSGGQHLPDRQGYRPVLVNRKLASLGRRLPKRLAKRVFLPSDTMP